MEDDALLLDLHTLSTLEAALGDDLQEVVAVLCSSLPTQISHLQAALKGDDPAEIHRCAHSLKGCAGNVGALALSCLARDIERQARAEQTPAAELGARAATLATATLQALRERYRLPA
ncbi:Hpt domain-containing protein [Pseudomonas sp. MAP12]|uniref:Hpt domain-containing protein n=1 Tax=Geopseudomonas aromaticivorans TaxID=2849492 RepID=A0ABS6N1S4_9GAMM|nr:Hpt domain-containing protein [Pseudomonas aromaticivorans]MBV2134990.1 Hpt domain-containing protein [Pseudomonas aromaticivorans]